MSFYSQKESSPSMDVIVFFTLIKKKEYFSCMHQYNGYRATFLL